MPPKRNRAWIEVKRYRVYWVQRGSRARCAEEAQRTSREVVRGGARKPRTKLAEARHSLARQTLPRRLDRSRQIWTHVRPDPVKMQCVPAEWVLWSCCRSFRPFPSADIKVRHLHSSNLALADEIAHFGLLNAKVASNY
jgi:hypothetical protein